MIVCHIILVWLTWGVEALSELFKNASDSIPSQIILSALNDKFWSIRKDAVEIVKEIQPGHDEEIKRKLITMAKSDEKSDVRVVAINYIAANFQSEEMNNLFKNAFEIIYSQTKQIQIIAIFL